MSIPLAFFQLVFFITLKYQRRELTQVLYPEDIEYDLFDSYQAFIDECYNNTDFADLNPEFEF